MPDPLAERDRVITALQAAASAAYLSHSIAISSQHEPNGVASYAADDKLDTLARRVTSH